MLACNYRPCILAILVVMVGKAAADCTPSGNAQVANVNFPDEFIINIEVVKTESKSVEYLEMYYSKVLNMIRIDSMDTQGKTSQYYDFKNNEILTFTFKDGRGKCSVDTDLRNHADPFIFGGIKKKQNPPEIPLPMAALHFSGNSGFPDKPDILQSPFGSSSTKIRGKDTVGYKSCQTWTSSSTNVVLTVKHYFAAAKYTFPWQRNFNGQKDTSTLSNLLQMTVEGTGTVNGKNMDLKHMYNFYNHKRIASYSTAFETPDGIVCDGRKQSKQLPNLPTHIRFTSETIDRTSNRMMTVEEIYDFERQVGVLRQPEQDSNGLDVNRLASILDFKSGKQYNVDEFMNICVVKNISDFGKMSMFYSVKNGKVTMDNPTQFFRAEVSDFAYLGQKKVRGLMADTFVAKSSDFPGLPDAVLQWQFAPPIKTWNDDVPEYKQNNWPYPIKYKFWKDLTTKEALVSNIFHVDYRPLTPDHDLTNCFKNKQHFQLVISGSKKVLSGMAIEDFKDEVTKQVATVAGVRPIQVNQVKIFYLNNDVVVEFFVVSDNDLKAASDKIQSAVKHGKVTLTVKGSKNLAFDKAASVYVNRQISTFKSSDSGHSPGALAGVAVGTLLVGLAGGVGAGFAHSKFFGKPF